MSSDYLYVHKKILPEYLEKVIQARNLLESHDVNTVTEAVEKTGISRNTYYKYKDYVFSEEDHSLRRHAVLSLILRDKPGVLSTVMTRLTDMHTSILTISQAIPIAGKANVLLSIDISEISGTVDELIKALKEIKAVRSVHLDAME
jgi:chorismate mutase